MWIMFKVVLLGICLFHFGTYDSWVVLSDADVFTSCLGLWKVSVSWTFRSRYLAPYTHTPNLDLSQSPE